jgi:hypothetical protein
MWKGSGKEPVQHFGDRRPDLALPIDQIGQFLASRFAHRAVLHRQRLLIVYRNSGINSPATFSTGSLPSPERGENLGFSKARFLGLSKPQPTMATEYPFRPGGFIITRQFGQGYRDNSRASRMVK